MVPSVTEKLVLVAIGDFMTNIMPPSVKTVIGQINRVPAPANSPGSDYIVLTPFQRSRFGTDIDTSNDVSFVGSIDGAVLIVTEILIGEIEADSLLFGIGVSSGTKIVNQASGETGGVGTYTVSVSQSISSTTLASGTLLIDQSTEMIINAEVHGPNSSDNSQVITTLFRNEYAVVFPSFHDNGISPLYADDPRQLPFLSAADQYENRWIIPLHLQIIPIVSVPQQYADMASITVIDASILELIGSGPSLDFSDPDNSQYLPGLGL